MIPAVAKRILLIGGWFHGERIGAHLAEAEANERLGRDALFGIQRDKLERLLRFVLQHNPYYVRKFAEINPLDDFIRVPLLTKQELRENFLALVTPGSGRLERCKTSGSTGEPLKFFRDPMVFGHTLASVYRAHRWHGLDVGAREAMLWGIPSGRLARLRVRLRDMALNRFRERAYDLSPEVLNHFFETVSRKRPEYLFGYSSMVYEFALFVRERQYDGAALKLRAAICTAETIHDHQRTVIEETFACPVVSEYGSAETGIISYQCPTGSHHISDDCVLVELLDDEGNPVPDGEVGRVVVTVLHSQSAPIIRYELGDYAVRRPGTCACGSSLSMLERIVGRTSGVIVTPSGRCFHSIAVYYVMKEFADRFGGLRQFRVVQTEVDHLEFHVVESAELPDAAFDWLGNAIRRRFGSDITVEFIRCDRLERTAAGKLSDFESRLDSSRSLLASFSAQKTTSAA